MAVMDAQDGPLSTANLYTSSGEDSKFQIPLFCHNKKETEEEEKEEEEEEVGREKKDRNPKQAGISLSPRCHASDDHPGEAVTVRVQRHRFLDMTTLAASWSSPSLRDTDFFSTAVIP